MKKYLSLLLLGTALTACSLAPEYATPDFSAASSWGEVSGYETPEGEAAASSLAWQDFFKSPELRQVIQIALDNNKDLKTAALNVEAARLTYRVQRTDLLPSVTAGAGATYQRTPREATGTGSSQKTETYSANLGMASYELDFFGRIKNLSDAALNQFFATQYAQNVARNSLIAETANAYLQLLADEKLLNLTRKTLKAQERTYNLMTKSLEQGVSTEQDLTSVETAVETARVNLHQYSRNVAQDKNALFLLLGVPQDDTILPKTKLDDIQLMEALNPGIPSDVLLLRPDIRQAEALLVAQNANIGAARAAFFPSISLTGSLGFASQGLTDLFSSGGAGAYNFAPAISVPIFNAGENKANLELAEVNKNLAVVSYQKAIQSAFQEVSDELSSRATLDKQLKSQRRLVAAEQKLYNISQARYNSGIDSYLSVLDAQRELYTYQQTEIETQRERLANLVNLYKSLGGGLVDKNEQTEETQK